MEIAIIGTENFCLGFRLAGIRKIFETNDPRESIAQVKEDTAIGIVVYEETLMKKLDADEKQSLEDSLRPIYISLSTQASDDSLKRMIRKSIGVEL